MITKPTIIITSLGRTGTLFFHCLFKAIIPNAVSLHEPDYLNYGQFDHWSERIKNIISQLGASGFCNLVIKKGLGRWSMVNLSDARVAGKISYTDAARKVLKQRREFVQTRKGAVYVESSSAYYGLIDVLKDVYARHRAVYIVRDGRDWVRSKMNWGKMYKKGGIRAMISHTWPKASDLEGDLYHLEWWKMSRFEKICWAWTRLNEYSLRTIEENPCARMFRFEDLFRSNDRYEHLHALVRFVTDFPEIKPITPAALEGWLERDVHKSSGHFPPWREWPAEYKKQFMAISGPLMRELEYDFD